METSNSTSPKILVEMVPTPGIKQVALNPNQLGQRSLTALDNAMGAIQEMSSRLSTTMEQILSSNKEVEVSFGLKLTMEGSAIITKAGVEATINVKITFKKEGA